MDLPGFILFVTYMDHPAVKAFKRLNNQILVLFHQNGMRIENNRIVERETANNSDSSQTAAVQNSSPPSSSVVRCAKVPEMLMATRHTPFSFQAPALDTSNTHLIMNQAQNQHKAIMETMNHLYNAFHFNCGQNNEILQQMTKIQSETEEMRQTHDQLRLTNDELLTQMEHLKTRSAQSLETTLQQNRDLGNQMNELRNINQKLAVENATLKHQKGQISKSQGITFLQHIDKLSQRHKCLFTPHDKVNIQGIMRHVFLYIEGAEARKENGGYITRLQDENLYRNVGDLWVHMQKPSTVRFIRRFPHTERHLDGYYLQQLKQNNLSFPESSHIHIHKRKSAFLPVARKHASCRPWEGVVHGVLSSA